MITVALAPKRLQLLHEVIPVPADMAMLANPSSPYFDQEKMDVMASARATVYQWREFATIGGLMSYGTSILAAYQQAGLTSRKY